MNQNSDFCYTISKTWEGETPPEKSEIVLKLSPENKDSSSDLLIEIDAPYYNDPIVPSTIPAGSTPYLWDYEVVELFFLGEGNKYLELEFGPKGHFLILQFDGYRILLEEGLPLEVGQFTTEITENRWKGRAVIPRKYFPEKVNSMNAYGIYKSENERVYMALFPVEKGKHDSPDFHRLEYFQKIDFDKLMRS